MTRHVELIENSYQYKISQRAMLSDPTRERVVEVLGKWLTLLRQCIQEAQDLGEIDPNVEVAQVVFEIEAMLLAANFLFVMLNDSIHLTLARKGVENVLARLAVSAESKKKRAARGMP
jgi:hypothetical protein